MSRYVGEAQDQLRQIARELRSVHYRLLGIVASLPVPPPEERLMDEMDAGGADAATEIRAAVECVLADRIRPAIQGLLAAAEVPLEEEEDREVVTEEGR
ncbi:MAG TPA: hypothetical protein VGH73_03140 [Thermoanaerobaculia bacterium]|jgi:hypothetical protein